jgi:hypothetical protein
MNNERTISINPQFLNISKKKMKMLKPQVNENTNTSEVKLNTANIRQLLLDRLRQHKKKKNQKTQKFPIQLNTMDEQINLETIEHHIPLTKFNVSSSDFDSISDKIQTQSQILNEKPYGNLKNGTKPTFKTWTNKPNISDSVMSKTFTSQPFTSEPFTSQPFTSEPFTSQPFTSESTTTDTLICKPIIPKHIPEHITPEPMECTVIEEREIKKTFNIGKNKKENAVSILIKNNHTRKKIESDKLALKKTSLSTLKNFLKKQNLIKFGSTAPNQLLREIYENTKLCGDIINENPQNILHNFKET